MSLLFLEDIYVCSDRIRALLAKDRTLHGQKRLLKWSRGRKLLDDALQSAASLPSDKTLELAEWIDDDLPLVTTGLPVFLTFGWAYSTMSWILEVVQSIDISGSRTQALLLIAEDAHGPLGMLKRAERLLTGITSFVLTRNLFVDDVGQPPAELENIIRLLCLILDAVAESKLPGSSLHHHLGELLLRLSGKDKCRALLADKRILGFTKLGQLLYTSQSSTLSCSLLRLIQRILPEHIKGSGKSSARATCCKDIIIKQGWSLAVAKEGLAAIGRMEKDLEPSSLAKLVDIFAKDLSLPRPRAFIMTSMSIDGDDQAADDDAKESLEAGNMILYIDTWGWRFEMGGKLGSEVCFSYPHKEVQSTTISSDDASATHQLLATSLLGDTILVNFSTPTPDVAALKSHLDLVSPRPASTPDPAQTPSSVAEDLVKPYPKSVKSEKIIVPAEKVQEMKRCRRFASLGRSLTPGPDVFSELEDDAKPKHKGKNSDNSVSAGEEEGNVNAGNKITGEVEAKKEKVPVLAKAGRQDSESEDEFFVHRKIMISTPKNAVAKTYGSRSSSRRPMLPKTSLLNPSSDEESDTSIASANGKASKVSSRKKPVSTLSADSAVNSKKPKRVGRLQTKASTLAGSIKIGREATPGSLKDDSVGREVKKTADKVQKDIKAEPPVVATKSKRNAPPPAASPPISEEDEDENLVSQDDDITQGNTLSSAEMDVDEDEATTVTGNAKAKMKQTKKTVSNSESESGTDVPLLNTRPTRANIKLRIADPSSDFEAEIPPPFFSPKLRRTSRKRVSKVSLLRVDPDEDGSSEIGKASQRIKRRIESSDDEEEVPKKEKKGRVVTVGEPMKGKPKEEDGRKNALASKTIKAKAKTRIIKDTPPAAKPNKSSGKNSQLPASAALDKANPASASNTHQSSHPATNIGVRTLVVDVGLDEDGDEPQVFWKNVRWEDPDMTGASMKVEKNTTNKKATPAPRNEATEAVAPRKSIKEIIASLKNQSKVPPKRKRPPPPLPRQSSDHLDLDINSDEPDPIESDAPLEDESEEPSPKAVKVKKGSVKKGMAKKDSEKGKKELLSVKKDKDEKETSKSISESRKVGEVEKLSAVSMAKEVSAVLKKNARSTRARAR
ncbi:hypothetical protein IAR50_005674 [Cryptococcus sp. DSM 104548]